MQAVLKTFFEKYFRNLSKAAGFLTGCAQPVLPGDGLR
jgi:hypothetical protein